MAKSSRKKMVFVIHENAPKPNRVNIEEIELLWKDEPVFLRPKPEHYLQDVFKILGKNPQKLEEINKLRPERPLAISHI